MVTHNFPPNGCANNGSELFRPSPPPLSLRNVCILYTVFHFPPSFYRVTEIAGLSKALFAVDPSVRNLIMRAKKPGKESPPRIPDGSRYLHERCTPPFYSIPLTKLQTGMMHRNRVVFSIGAPADFLPRLSGRAAPRRDC